MDTAQFWLENMCRDVEYPMVFKTMIHEYNRDHRYEQNQPFLPKVFYNLGKIENRHTHWTTYEKGTDRIIKAYNQEVPSLGLHHDNTMRSEERDEIMLNFQAENIEREKKMAKAIDRDRFYG
jgi:hypothetical protein